MEELRPTVPTEVDASTEAMGRLMVQQQLMQYAQQAGVGMQPGPSTHSLGHWQQSPWAPPMSSVYTGGQMQMPPMLMPPQEPKMPIIQEIEPEECEFCGGLARVGGRAEFCGGLARVCGRAFR